MKTERRHELQSNELAHLLKTYQTSVKPYVSWIVGGIAFVAVIWVALGWMRTSRERQLSGSWTEYVRASKARDKDLLRDIAQRYPRTPAAGRALYTAGYLGLHSGTSKLLTERGDAIAELHEARDDFHAAIQTSQKDSYLTPQALIGLAQTYESLNDLDAAKEQYQRIIEAYATTGFARTAKARLDFLNLADTVAFSDWISKQKIDVAQSASTSDRSLRGPSIGDDLPISSDLLLPDIEALEASRSDSDLGPMIPPTEGTEPEATGPRLDLGPPLSTSSEDADGTGTDSETDANTKAQPPDDEAAEDESDSR